MKNIFKIITLIMMGFFLDACYYDSFPEEIDGPGEPIPEEVSYKTDIMPLWEGQCAACHKGTQPPDLRPEFSYESLLDGYVVPNSAEASVLYKSLLGTDGISLMPPGVKWPNSKIDLVKAWIDQGAKNN